MRELEKVREELDRSWDYLLATENAVLAQRRRAKELEAIYAEERANNPAMPTSMRNG